MGDKIQPSTKDLQLCYRLAWSFDLKASIKELSCAIVNIESMRKRTGGHHCDVEPLAGPSINPARRCAPS